MRGMRIVRGAMLATLAFAAGCAQSPPDTSEDQAASKGKTTSPVCPGIKSLKNFATSNNVAAWAATVGDTTTYWFQSVNEDPVAGTPGLVKYCVYPSSVPTSHTVDAVGWDGEDWVYSAGSANFSFGRPGGASSNIPLDGATVQMGTATWGAAAPSGQILLVHIADPTVCESLYGTLDTCFVKPGHIGPICDAGDSDVAYNAIPSGVVDCSPPSLAFEAQSVSEFGDEVGLAGTARGLDSLSVVFNSYACSVSGHWYTAGDPCVTTTGDTFTHPLTANIYAVASCTGTPCKGSLLATVTQTETLPYRPTADSTCADAAQWRNPITNLCQYSIVKVVTFNFPPGVTLPDEVIWTVAYNTTHYGYSPIGESASCFSTAVGCGYDSLNVGTKTYLGAPYAGTDVDPAGAFLFSSWSGAYCDAGTAGSLRLDTGSPCWTQYKPLGEIRTE